MIFIISRLVPLNYSKEIFRQHAGRQWFLIFFFVTLKGLAKIGHMSHSASGDSLRQQRERA